MADVYCARCGNRISGGRKGQLFCSSYCNYKFYHNGPLILPIKGEWFRMILKGKKTEEYREMKPYWEKRFENYFGKHYSGSMKDDIGNPVAVWNGEKKDIIFRNGYGKNAPKFTAECIIYEGTGKTEWGAKEGVRYYILKILAITEKYNCDGIELEKVG